MSPDSTLTDALTCSVGYRTLSRLPQREANLCCKSRARRENAFRLPDKPSRLFASPAGLLSEITASIKQSGSSPQSAIIPRIDSETRFHIVSLSRHETFVGNEPTHRLAGLSIGLDRKWAGRSIHSQIYQSALLGSRLGTKPGRPHRGSRDDLAGVGKSSRGRCT